MNNKILGNAAAAAARRTSRESVAARKDRFCPRRKIQWRIRWVAGVVAFGTFAGALAVSAPVISVLVAEAASPTGSAYSPISPIRVADSRDGFGIASKLRGQDTRTLKAVTPAVAAAAGVSASNVSAVAVQVTATQTTGPGYFTVFPADKSRPLASSLNIMRPNHTLTNLVSVPVSPSGEIKIYSHSGSHVVVDVQGVFVESNSARAGRLELFDAPYRHLDTRESRKLGAKSTTVIDLSARVPRNATAAVVNLTSVNNSAQGFLTAFPYGSTLPNASNLNYPDPALRTAVGSQGYVALKDGKFNVYSSVQTDLVIDVAGYFTGSDAPVSSDGLFVPVTPFRMLDTREASNVPSCFKSGRVRSGGAIPVSVANRGGVPASNVYAVAANIALTQTRGPGWARVWPAGGNEPETSSVNSGFANHTVANHAATKIGTAGIGVRTASGMHIIVDVTGYFLGSTTPAVADVECTPSETQPLNDVRGDLGQEFPAPVSRTAAERIADEVVVLTNARRAEVGARPVTIHLALVEAGKIHAEDQIGARCATGYLTHTGTDGSRIGDRIARTGWNVNGGGENLACGHVTAEQVVQAWMDSPGHRVNLLNPLWTHIGVYAINYENQPGPQAGWAGYYWAQIFGMDPCPVPVENACRGYWRDGVRLDGNGNPM
ncbi:MAG: CAP domain-containing protein [Ilumatobacter sp.]|nr:CAP domain-containing protein [Ilumatobacter sp.]